MKGLRPQIIIGTAGHIDHGKTALVKALTGVDADTLGEEKRRGITIELGFVFAPEASSPRQIVFIDVPGHEKFIKTMVAGASNLDAALLVIAADDGVARQTREHCDILHLLGVSRGVIALSKADLVDEKRLAEVREQARQLVASTALSEAPVIAVSAYSGQGLAELRAALVELGDQSPVRYDSGVFRLPVDRAFTRAGFGTVVTGTVVGGEVGEGERVMIYPEALPARVRGIQVQGKGVDRSGTGWRTALNLMEVKRTELRRGQVVAAPDSLTPTHRLDAKLQLLPGATSPLRHRTRLRLHVGTAELIGRLSLLDGEALRPGEVGLVQFILEAPTVALPGDRLVVRSFSPVDTLGGGVVLDGSPPAHRRFDPTVLEHLQQLQAGSQQRVAAALQRSGRQPVSVEQLVQLTGCQAAEIDQALQNLARQGQLRTLGESPAMYLAESGYQQLREVVLEGLAAYYATHPLQVYMAAAEMQAQLRQLTSRLAAEQVLTELAAEGVIRRADNRLALAGRQPRYTAAEQQLAARMTAAFEQAGLNAPLESELQANWGEAPDRWQRVMSSLTDQGILVRLNDKVTYHARTLESATRQVGRLLARQGQITVGEVREALGVSRKYVIALLEYLDERGLTRRQGEVRVAAKR